MLKGNVGCGILAMGDAFKNGGLFLSPVLTIIMGVICVYNQHLLVRNNYKTTQITVNENTFKILHPYIPTPLHPISLHPVFCTAS